MKKQVLAFGFKRVIVLSGLVGVLTLSSFKPANNENTNNTNSTQSAIKYVGTNDAGIIFNVKYENADSSKFDLVIRNQYGDVVFQQQYSETNFDKKIVLVKEPGDAVLTFMIKSPKESYQQTYQINTTTRVVEDVVVKPTK